MNEFFTVFCRLVQKTEHYWEAKNFFRSSQTKTVLVGFGKFHSDFREAVSEEKRGAGITNKTCSSTLKILSNRCSSYLNIVNGLGTIKNVVLR